MIYIPPAALDSVPGKWRDENLEDLEVHAEALLELVAMLIHWATRPEETGVHRMSYEKIGSILASWVMEGQSSFTFMTTVAEYIAEEYPYIGELGEHVAKCVSHFGWDRLSGHALALTIIRQ